MIWNDFKENGYVILFVEDEFFISVFNLRFNGFKESFLDYYMRLFWLVLWDSEFRERSNKYCIGVTLYYRFLLEYLKDFYVKYSIVLKFFLIFFVELIYWNNNFGEYLDVDFVNILEKFSKLGFFDNIFLIVMGDYGVRYGRVRRIV